MVKIKYKKYLFAFATFLLIYFIVPKNSIEFNEWQIKLNLGFLDEFDLINYTIHNYFDENEEWEILDKNIYIAKNLSFYFVNDGIINTIIISRNLLRENLVCIVNVSTENSYKLYTIKAKLYTLEVQDQSSYKLQCLFPQYKNSYHNDLNGHDFHLYIYNWKKDIGIERTKRNIKLKLKFKNKNKDQRHSALCGPMLYLDSPESYENFVLWLNFNIKMGFQKIILYVILVEKEDMFNELISKYKDTVEVRPYKSIPNAHYLRENLISPFITPVVYIKSKHERTHWVHHRAVINGCFLSCVNDFERVAVFDIDELIIPNNGQLHNMLDISEIPFKYSQMINKIPLFDTLKCENNINRYIDNLNVMNFKKESVEHISYRFFNSYYIDASFVNNLFYYFKLNISSLHHFRNAFQIPVHHNGDFFFSILTEKDFYYLKFLINFYDSYYVKKFLQKNVSTSPLNRIWMLQETFQTEFGFGKVSFSNFSC